MNAKRFLIGLAALAALAGCGGGGGGGSTPGSGSAYNVFITDNLNDNYDHVWVRIDRVELIGASGTTTIFQDAEGRFVDLSSLNQSGEQRFSLIGRRSVPAGEFTQVRYTLGPTVSLVPKGGTTALQKTLTTRVVSASVPAGASASRNIVSDFDLSKWTEGATTVTPVVVGHNGSGLDDDDRHETDDFEGTVANLSGTAPNQSFDMAFAGGTVRVKLSSVTAVYNSDGAPNPTLANGQRVEVRGRYSLAEAAFLAVAVKIEDSDDDDDEVYGTIVSESDTAIRMRVGQAYGFLPAGTEIDVVFAANTIFRTDDGVVITKPEFLEMVAPGTEIEAEGTFQNGQIIATKLKIEDEDDDGFNESEVEGRTVAFNAANETLRISAEEWEGISLSPGAQVDVVVTANTEYRDDDNEITADEFFARLANGAFVEAKGTFGSSVMTARRLELDDDSDDDDD